MLSIGFKSNQQVASGQEYSWNQSNQEIKQFRNRENVVLWIVVSTNSSIEKIIFGIMVILKMFLNLDHANINN